MAGERLEARMYEWFQGWSSVLRQAFRDPQRREPSVSFPIDPDRARTARIYRDAAGVPRIAIYEPFLRELEAAVTAHEADLPQACLSGLDPSFATPDAARLVTSCITDLAAAFVLLHELFHLLLGHVDAEAGTQGEFCYDEDEIVRSPAAATAADDTELDAAWLAAYFLELEADASAVQWLMRAPLLNSIAALGAHVSEPDTAPEWPDDSDAIELLEGNARLVAFRALVAAVWIVVRLLERRRGAALRTRTPSHPLPGARMLAIGFILLEQYAELTAVEVDASGRRTQQLSSDTLVADVKSFFRDVLRPVMRVVWPVHDPEAAETGYESSPVVTVEEFGRIFLRDEARTAPGRELQRVETLRHAMLARLERYRYLDLERLDSILGY